MSPKKNREKQIKQKKGLRLISKIIIVAIFISLVAIVINLAPNYIQDKLADKTNIIINNNNVTSSLKYDIKIKDDTIYISSKDIANFFDEHIYYDNKYNQIITGSETKIAAIEVGKKEMNVNGSKVSIYEPIIEEDNTFYIPFSELKDVYNVDVKYSKEKDIVTIDSLNREQKMGNSSNDAGIKYKPTAFSKDLEKVKKGDSVVVIGEEDGWYKVRTNSGVIGYLKDVANIYSTRQDLVKEKQINGKISLMWDYFTFNAPTRTGNIKGINVVSPSFASLVKLGKGELITRIGTNGTNYINWAHNNGYKVWTIISNDGMQETTSEILNDYKLRKALIDNIVNFVMANDMDGVNIDFENVKASDKDMLTRFMIELAPRLAEYEKVVSIDVTAPDGGSDWSESFNRHELSKVVDYMMFMAYDEYGDAAPTAGTTAGADWIETNLKKFVGTQEDVDKNKLVLGMPFYTRLWKETGDNLTNTSILLKNINSNIPSGVEKVWKEDLKQYYIEYNSGNSTYKMWIEDEKSLQAKFDLMRKYELAGAAYWQKDFETDSILDLIYTEINK